jgi:hypothetical protein
MSILSRKFKPFYQTKIKGVLTMKKISLCSRRLLAVIALVVLLIAAVPVASASGNYTEIYDTQFEFKKINLSLTATNAISTNAPGMYIGAFNSIDSLQTIFYRPAPGANNFELINEAVNTQTKPVYLRSGSSSGAIVGKGNYTYFKGATSAQSHIRIDIDTYDKSVSNVNNKFFIDFLGDTNNLRWVYGVAEPSGESFYLFSGREDRSIPYAGEYQIEYYSNFLNTFTLTEYNADEYKLTYSRDGSNLYDSRITIYDKNGNTLLNNSGVSSSYIYVNKDSEPYTIQVYSTVYQKDYITYLGDGEPWLPPTAEPTPIPTEDPDDPNVIVYVKNSQTGALIANANIAIDALVNGEYYPVVNRTEPSGIFSINLQPTGGGQPNPDGYRLIVTADGYNNPMPEINFTVDDYKQSIYCLLDPIAGGPVNENKTFIDFFVRDMKSNPISGATVKFGKYTLITNSAGYTVFEVDKNNNYTWTVSKSGYGPLTGNAVIGDSPRHTINTVLAPIVTPTTTTPIPTSPPIGPTPIMTAPTGEPVSNWLEWFAAHFGMVLGGGVEIGKIFMWLCFTVPVGVYVGKESKAGAAGFMAGAGIVTLFFVLIGWVPIWLVVLLALIIGLLYAKVFNTPDNGGGR